MNTDTKEFALRRRLVLPSPSEVAALDPDDLYPTPSAGRFTESEFIEATDLEAMADLLIEKWPELRFIEGVRVRYLWKQKASGRAQAKCTKASGFWRRLADVDFVIWMGADICRALFYTREQVEALLYHELRHIGWDDEKGEPVSVDHDQEVFFDEFRRYGLWASDQSKFGQLSLDGAFTRGQGLQGPRFDYCPSCSEVIRLVNGCPTCTPLPEPSASVACTSCGTVQEQAMPPLVGGVCGDCRAESALGMGDDA